MTPEELEKLRNGNTKATVSESVKFERESPEETAKNHTLPSSALVDGDKQATVNLSPLDLKSSQDYYKVSNVDFAYRGENFVCKSSLKGTNHLLPVVLPKAEEPSKEKQKKAYFDYVQGETYTYEYLHEPTPKVIKNNNYVGLYEYLFIKEFEACKNGFLYYLVPLFLGVLGIILSFLEGAHILYNCLASVVVLLALLVIYPVFKDVTLSFAGLILRALAFVLIVAGSVMALVFLPQFRAQINVYIVFRLLVIVFDLYYTIKFYAIFFKMYAEDCKTNFANVVSVNAGQPRVGKTSEAINEAIVLAHLQYARLRKEFQRWHSREAKIFKRNNFEELVYYRHLVESYTQCVMSPCIPCLYSAIGIEDEKGRRSHILELDHIRGLKKLPLYAVLFLDEIGAYIKAELAQDKERPYDISDMFRLGGQYLKWIVLASEQDFSNIYIDCRRVVGFNRIVLSQEKVNNPVLLQSIYNLLTFFEEEGTLTKIKSTPKWSAFLDKFEDLIKSIGFRKYTFSYVSNTETGAEVKGVKAKKVKYTPACLLGSYASEAFRYQYPPLYDKGIEFKTHESLYVDFIEGKGDQFVSKTKTVAEKRKQVREALKPLYQQIKQANEAKNENNVSEKKAG